MPTQLLMLPLQSLHPQMQLYAAAVAPSALLLINLVDQELLALAEAQQELLLLCHQI